MNLLGILYLNQDPAASLIMDGKIIAIAEEERFVRKKHAFGHFPKESINFCLNEGKISMKDIDFITIGWDVNAYSTIVKDHFEKTKEEYPMKDEMTLQWEKRLLKRYNKENYLKTIYEELIKCGYSKNQIPPIKFFGHHYSHAVSAYFASGFNDAVILTIDGHGEHNSTVIWVANNGKIKKIKEINIPHSLGWFYAAITRFCGFRPNNGEGKTMGLAPYGKPNLKIRDFMNEMCRIKEMDYEIDPTYLFYSKRSFAKEFTDKFVERLGMPRRENEKIQQHHKDTAYEAQKLLEKIVLYLVESLIEHTGIKNVCLAGGVALNCKMNGVIHSSSKVNKLFIQPISQDVGTTFGSSLALCLERGIDISQFKMNHVYFGPEFSNEEIKKYLDSFSLDYKYEPKIEYETAKYLSNGMIVGWFQGKMEVGPRALGNRSILADPRDIKMKDKVNNKVKYREPWRPFCPSILEEYKEDYLIKPISHPFMILTFKVKENKISEIPSVVHIDKTARVQTVKKEDAPMFWTLINEFRKITGIPVLLNTSFNIRGEPIVCTPKDAIEDFLRTGIDILAIGNYVVMKGR